MRNKSRIIIIALVLCAGLLIFPILNLPLTKRACSQYWCMEIDCFSDSACGNSCICVYIDGSVSGVCARHDG